METNEIPSVPTTSLEPNDQTGLKNLAGWIARYKNFGLEICEVSSFMYKLFENGTLAKFEPSLIGLEVGYGGSEEDYERYEFDATIYDFVDLREDSASLHFSFISGKCAMWIEYFEQSNNGSLSCALEKIFDAIDVEPLLEKEYLRNITWQEADEIILKYLKYMKNPEIPPVPES